MRIFLIVLDSVGIGEAPDAADYGDSGASTLAHISHAAGGLNIPVLAAMGLGNIPLLIPGGLPIRGAIPTASPTASFGALREVSRGKDTTTGHWEMAGLELKNGFRLFPHDYPSFPEGLISVFESRTGRKVIGNKAASGTVIIDELGPRQIKTGEWIVYTSGDSVFQIAAHEEIIPVPELYRGCEIARELCNEHMIGRVIARPYVGKPGAFKRTENRRDFSYPLPEATVLDRLKASGISVTTVGKLDDIFAGKGISDSIHVENNRDAIKAVIELAQGKSEGLIFANLIDFDMLYGHRRDYTGYARAIENADEFLGRLTGLARSDDVIIVTADHGNDPTFRGSDHTREYVPLLVWRGSEPIGKSLGIRNGYFDIAQSIATAFKSGTMPRGISFL